MEYFWDFSVWGSFNVIAILLISLLVANALKRLIKPLGNSLIPTSVLGGIMLLIISSIYTGVTKEYLFDTQFFGGNGAAFWRSSPITRWRSASSPRRSRRPRAR